MKMFSPWTATALAVVLAIPLALPANAQTATFSQPIQHLAPGAMSPADRAALNTRLGELAESAKVYGYNLEAENWSYEQTLCASMPHTILLHYFQRFSDGTESLFTVLVPRGQGRLRVVPILYHNATPYLPAPRNPSNYALFNQLVPESIASADIASTNRWLELSACYAELTGASIDFSSNRTASIGIAQAPAATIHLDAQGKTAHVMFADRDGSHAYRMWKISFSREGRVIAAGTENYSVYAAKAQPQAQTPLQLQPSATAGTQQPAEASGSSPEQVPEQVQTRNGQSGQRAEAEPAQPEPTATAPPHPAAAAAQPVAAATAQPASGTRQTAAVSAPQGPIPASGREAPEPGWKFIPQPPQPTSVFIPSAPPPPEKMMPKPPDPWDKSVSESQQPQ